MKVIKVNNVNDAFNRGVDLFQIDINYRRQESRNGVTLEANEPVTTVYARPWERVLFDKTRDANPFFHLIEAIWMIAGSHELDPIIKFNAGMVQFSDDGETLNGAYGYRWMNQFDFDQIPYIINILKQDPDSRRAVLQMWDAVNDLENLK
jgi:thymidylate synthase